MSPDLFDPLLCDHMLLPGDLLDFSLEGGTQERSLLVSAFYDRPGFRPCSGENALEQLVSVSIAHNETPIASFTKAFKSLETYPLLRSGISTIRGNVSLNI